MASDKKQEELSPEIKKLLENAERSEAVRPNRATRRRKPIVDPWFTKATHKFKKIRKKNAKKRQQRQRAAKRARKASQKDSTKVS